MKPLDLLLPVRRAILAALKADSGLIALVPRTSIYPQSPPALPVWPFIRYGSPTNLPTRGVCAGGSDVSGAVHGFSKGRDGQESAEDHAARIGAAIVAAIEGKRIDLAPGRVVVTWTGSQLLQDGDEAGAYHVVVNFLARALS